MSAKIKTKAQDMQTKLREKFARKEIDWETFCKCYDAIDEIAGTAPEHKGAALFSIGDIESSATVVQL